MRLYRNELPILAVLLLCLLVVGCDEDTFKPVERPITETDVFTQVVVEQPPEVVIETPEVVVEPIIREKTIIGFTSEYDDLFKKYSEMYLPYHDYRWLKAQCIQESGLRPDVESWAGAKGLCQFMGVTWKEVSGELSFKTESSPYDPTLSVQAAAYYMAKLRKGWSSPRPESDRMNLARASYNAGFGSLLSAQEKCGNKNLYDEIIVCLVLVTGERNSNETTHYVKNIKKYYTRLVFYDE